VHSGSFRVRAGVKTSLVTDSENEIVDDTVASPATVPSSLDRKTYYQSARV